MAVELADADTLHRRFFDRWYRPADRERKGFAATRPDLLRIGGFRGVAAEELSPLAPERQRDVLAMIDRMVVAARTDWKDLVGPYDVLAREGLLAIDQGFDVDHVRHLIDGADAADFGNSYVVTVCELGAVLGGALKSARTTLQWVPDWPYFESALVDRATGHVIPPFHWAIKRLSATACDQGLVEKIGACLEVLAKSPP